MSAVPSPNAPSSIARRIAARMESRGAPVAAPMRRPMPYSRSVLAPTNEPTFGEMPFASIARSQVSKPRGPMNRRAAAAAGRSPVRPPIVCSLTGAAVYASPRISVVTPWVSLPTLRPSPPRNPPPPLWMSMKPGATTIPVASMRRRADRASSEPRRPIAAMRSPRMPTSP